jgi:glycine betaine/choline ABC-type transport system substrate-binding protein
MKPVIPILLVIAVSCSARAWQIVIASKKFTESYVLGEIAKRTLVNAGFAAELRQGIGAPVYRRSRRQSGNPLQDWD